MARWPLLIQWLGVACVRAGYSLTAMTRSVPCTEEQLNTRGAPDVGAWRRLSARGKRVLRGSAQFEVPNDYVTRAPNARMAAAMLKGGALCGAKASCRLLKRCGLRGVTAHGCRVLPRVWQEVSMATH